MMLRWICAMLVGSMFLVGSSQADQQVPMRLLTAVEKIGVSPDTYVVHHSGRTSSLMTPSQASKNMREWVNELKLSHLKKSVDQDGIRYDATGTWEKGLSVSFNLIIDHPEQTKSQPYVAIQVTGHGRPGGAWQRAAERMETFLAKQAITSHLHYSIQGSVKESSMQLTTQKLMKQLDAKEIEGLKTNETVSISAYSPVLAETIQTRGGAMNLQVATHRDMSTGKLIVTIGSPIITIEY